MTNPIYQAVIAELEAVLSPRVVSRSLKEGLQQVGTTPERVTLEDLEKVLKGQVYRHLQATMPAERARDTVTEILGRLAEQASGAAPAHSRTVDLHAAALAELRASLRPYNLYFEWPEVPKLRAQLQLIENELEAGHEVSALLTEARQQLSAIAQKLEDELVDQARELAELEEALETVQPLGGPKVRRLESLIGQVRGAQAERQLASGEVERARRLATDLRKLLESSIYTERAGAGADAAGQPEELAARLLELDLESERHQLALLEQSQASLLAYRPELQAEFAAVRRQLDERVSAGERLRELQATLERAAAELQEELGGEVDAMAADTAAIAAPGSGQQLKQALQVARGILTTTLPKPDDLRHLRSLYALAREQAAEVERLRAEEDAAREARLREQAEVLAALESTLVRYERDDLGEELAGLSAGIDELRAAQARRDVAPEVVRRVRAEEERLEAALAGRGADPREVQRAALGTLRLRFRSLPLLPGLEERGRKLDAAFEQSFRHLERAPLPPAHLESAARAVSALEQELRGAYRERLAWLGQRAGTEPGSAFSARLARAAAALDGGEFPDLPALERELQTVLVGRRGALLAELRQLEEEAEAFRGVDLRGGTELQARLAAAREELQAGKGTPDLDALWQELEGLRAVALDRLAGFGQRLERALESFDRVERLNTEEVAAARKILMHLAGQQDAWERVSLRLQLRLEAALQEAEALLVGLEAEVEATRMIADQLVRGNVLDDLLGPLGIPDPPASREEPSETEAAPAEWEPQEVEGRDARVDAWLGTLLAERGVETAALVSETGELLSGRLVAPPAVSDAPLAEFERFALDLSAQLRLGSAELATLELPAGTLIVVWPADGYRLLIVLTEPSALSLVLHRLQRDLGRLRELLSDPAFAR